MTILNEFETHDISLLLITVAVLTFVIGTAFAIFYATEKSYANFICSSLFSVLGIALFVLWLNAVKYPFIKAEVVFDKEYRITVDEWYDLNIIEKRGEIYVIQRKEGEKE